MPQLKALRWWIIVLLMLGGIVNFLARNSLGIAKPTLSSELGLTDQQYALTLTCFQVGLILQPVCGYFLEWLGLRVGFALFAIAWSVVNMAHGLVGGWLGLASLRGLMGFAEGSANPAVMKTISAWFPARERGLASGIYNVGASLGSVLAPPLVAWAIYAYHWQAAFVVTGGIGIIWAGLWLALYRDPSLHPLLSEGERSYVLAGKERHLQSGSTPPSIISLLRQRNFWGIGLPRLLADPTWGTLSFWVPSYFVAARHFDLKQLAIFTWMPFLAADIGSLSGGLIASAVQRHTRLSLVNARRTAFTVGVLLMLPVAFVGTVESPYFAVGLLCLGGFAHQTLSVTVITMSTDLFRQNEVSTVTGMAGTCGNLGTMIFTLLLGKLLSTYGYAPFFVALPLLDVLGAGLLWALVRERSADNVDEPPLSAAH
ncbi:MAG TPA: MFS transporter [Polyangiaceae bacterium]|nr:MFS transporter [Polyangiaceae bacterium]